MAAPTERRISAQPELARQPPTSPLYPFPLVLPILMLLCPALFLYIEPASLLFAVPQSPPAGFPPGPPGDQSVGLLTEPLATISTLSAQHGDLVGLLLGGERVVLVSGPEAARTILMERADVFVKEGTAFFPGALRGTLTLCA